MPPFWIALSFASCVNIQCYIIYKLLSLLCSHFICLHDLDLENKSARNADGWGEISWESMCFSTGLTELCSTPEDRAEVLKVLLNSWQVIQSQAKEKDSRGQSRLLNALLESWCRWCLSTQPHGSMPFFLWFFALLLVVQWKKVEKKSWGVF